MGWTGYTAERHFDWDARTWRPVDPAFRGLAPRTRNCLLRNGIDRADVVRKMSDPELLGLRNFGDGALRDVRRVLGGRTTRPLLGAHPWWLRD
jgi:hypothetical protein